MSRAQRRAHLQTGHRPPQKVEPPAAAPSAQSSDGPPDLTDLDVAFGANDWRKLLPKWEELTNDEKRGRGPFCDALSSLFFNGGKLADHGIHVRDGVDSQKVHRYIRATLGDFGPKHEHKIGGIAHMLKKWCEYRPTGKRKH